MKIPICEKTVDRLRSADRLSGVDTLGGFAWSLDLSKPWIATAIHAGHNFREELVPLLSISEEARFYEEDPVTDQMIKECPNAVWGLDSRAEYDLNRLPKDAVPLTPEMFWGIEVYHTQPSAEMIRRSMEKYEAFYRFMGSLLTVLIERFGSCVVYDFHAYNIGRQVEKGHASPPAFNVGTEQLNREKWGKAIASWLEFLSNCTIPGETITSAENEVFFGKGGFCAALNQWNKNILVLPTEVSKIYMNEKTGAPYPDVIKKLVKELTLAVNGHGSFFSQEEKNFT
ncbi:MAG: N-formylglutamate amidohydrolase [bacterium]|nr:N-formylglutamate amidohydrolase [bacterium]